MRRAQAALEFLTTYGWAFLVILVMIGALAYFGILSPDRFLPERCNVGPEFSCDEYQVVGTNNPTPGRLSVRFSNNVGQTIGTVVLNRVWWNQEELNQTCCAGALAIVGGPNFRAGDPIGITADFDDTLFPPEGAKMKFNIEMTYIPQGKSFTKPLTAEVFTALQP